MNGKGNKETSYDFKKDVGTKAQEGFFVSFAKHLAEEGGIFLKLAHGTHTSILFFHSISEKRTYYH